MNIVGCRRGKKVINWTYDGMYPRYLYRPIYPHFCVAYVAVDLHPPHHCRQRYNSTAVSPLVSGGGPVSD